MNKPHLHYLPLLLFALALLNSCAQPQPPEDVVARFWQAALSNDKPAIRALTISDSFRVEDFDTARHHELFDSVVIGQTDIQDDRAEVNTRLQGVFYGEVDEVEFNTIAVIHHGNWKIDYPATASAMIGALLDVTFIEINQSMREELQDLGKRVGEAVREDLQDESLDPSR